MSSSTVLVPRCSVLFDGANYRNFVQHMHVHMRGLRLWGVLCGNVPCPSSLEPPTEPVQLTVDTGHQTAIDIADETVVSAYSEALEHYRDRLSDIAQWMDDDARAASILFASVEHRFSSEIVGFSTALQMWTYLRQTYEPSGDALYLSVVRQEQSLQQGDATVDVFYAQMSAVWRLLLVVTLVS